MAPRKPRPSPETEELRKALQAAYRIEWKDTGKPVGSFRWGVYAFFDYDHEPIYVGQTYEGLSSRVGRHLTNQRTDAVAMSVLDPFEVMVVRFYPLPEFDHVTKYLYEGSSRRNNPEFPPAKAALNSLELGVFRECISTSAFGAVLNEKDPAAVAAAFTSDFLEARIVSDAVATFRSHPDVRLARRAQTIARLAQVISERQVSQGLRRTLLTQSKRLQLLADRQFAAHGGTSSVPKKGEDDVEEASSS